ncbi:regulatory protein RecX [Carboxylicivirga mesophila]|uniref:Regulatory protein RecX n=2 Tax=Carboxylicivirga mesophila TaxID=1166478 RepID=A0ABS5K443_9BACT|nr:regulatory protein RecX [Carboxylicivirga mesophila]
MDCRQALNKAAALCSRKEYCTTDIRKKLVNWELGDEEVEAVLVRLVNEKFIDDSRYASYYVKDKFLFNGWGRIKIRFMLRSKGLSSSMIDEALEQIVDADYSEKLAELLHSKNRQIKNKDAWQTKAALVRFAQSRGFEPDIVYRLIDQYLEI